MKKKTDFGQRIEMLCEQKEITPNELARRISIPRTSVHEWVGASGRVPRNLEHLKKLCDFFDVSASFLLWGEDEKTPTLESFISKTEIHTGLYEITLKKVDPKSKK
ncbi:MAG: helix-turn-helix transcriptional regulator [Bdellovibrionaceae bacterium]|nr:helix-turn-helix transcriptional regulator [Pseudobdellovibrionaceae bacterium]